MWKIQDYPLMDVFLNAISPTELFRIEDEIFYDIGLTGSAIMMFTGLFIRDNESDMVHCIPVHFYGANAKYLTSLLKGVSLWLEITPRYPEGYFN